MSPEANTPARCFTGLVRSCAAFCIVIALSASGPVDQRRAKVLVDAPFVQVASALARQFAARSGYVLTLAVVAPDQTQTPDPLAHVMLAPDSQSADELEAAGLAVPGGLVYGSSAQGEPDGDLRRAVLLQPGRGHEAATSFLDYLSSPEAWDLIVAHNFGTH